MLNVLLNNSSSPSLKIAFPFDALFALNLELDIVIKSDDLTYTAPPSPAELLLKVQLSIVPSPIVFKTMAPPLSTAEFPEKIVFVISTSKSPGRTRIAPPPSR